MIEPMEPESKTVWEALKNTGTLLAKVSDLLDRAEALGDPDLVSETQDVAKRLLEYLPKLERFIDFTAGTQTAKLVLDLVIDGRGGKENQDRAVATSSGQVKPGRRPGGNS